MNISKFLKIYVVFCLILFNQTAYANEVLITNAKIYDGQSDNPYFLREINSLRDKLEAKFSQDEWRNEYHDNGISGSLQELTKLLEKSVETIFKLPLFLIHDSSEMLESLYNKSSSHAPFAYRFAASTDLLAKINFLL